MSTEIPKRRSVSKTEAAERAAKLADFMERDDIQQMLDSVKPHKRMTTLRDMFIEETGVNIPMSSFYKLLRPKEQSVKEDVTKEDFKIKPEEGFYESEQQVDAIPIDL